MDSGLLPAGQPVQILVSEKLKGVKGPNEGYPKSAKRYCTRATQFDPSNISAPAPAVQPSLVAECVDDIGPERSAEVVARGAVRDVRGRHGRAGRPGLKVGPGEAGGHVDHQRRIGEPTGAHSRAGIPGRRDLELVLWRSSERQAWRAEQKVGRIRAAVEGRRLVGVGEVALHPDDVGGRHLKIPAAIDAKADGDVIDVRHGAWSGTPPCKGTGLRLRYGR